MTWWGNISPNILSKANIEKAHLHSTSTDKNIHGVRIIILGIIVKNKPPNFSWPPYTIHSLPYLGISLEDLTIPTHSDHTATIMKTVKCQFNRQKKTTLIPFSTSRKKKHLNRLPREYNLDLCFVTADEQHYLWRHRKEYYRIIEIGTTIRLVIYPCSTWNFQKANWNAFCENLDVSGGTPRQPCNYDRSVDQVLSTAKIHIEGLYKDFLESEKSDIADDLVNNLDAACQAK